MIIFKKIKMKNFFSVGDNPLTIELSGNTPTLISGHNGAGKSVCIVDSICFALFGKPYKKVTKSEVINSINGKKCLVTLDIHMNGDDYTIKRGLKPSVFEIYKNDILLDQNAAVKDQQRLLEENIIKLNYDSFKQVVILSSSNFIPFMSLTAPQRRVVVESILDIEIFSKMNKIEKEKFSNLKEQYNLIDNSIMHKNNGLSQQRSIIDNYKADFSDSINEKTNNINEKKKELEKIVPEYEKQKKKYDDFCELFDYQYVATQTKLNNAERLFENNNRELQKYEKDLKRAIEIEDCYTCGQPLPKDERAETIKNLKEKIKEMSPIKEDLEKKYLSLKEKFSLVADLKNQKKSLENKTYSLKSDMEKIENYIQIFTKEVRQLKEKEKDNGNIKNEENKLKELEKEYKTLSDKFIKIGEQKTYSEIIIDLLKDDGIKSMIIEQYIPIINERVNFYLEKLNFFALFNLDKNFNETIKVRHRDDRNYTALSQGEKQRIDLALLFTWRDIAKMKNSINTNLLILDETFDSSLDHNGIDNLLLILEVFNDSNIFIISHKGDILSEVIETHLVFSKKNNFTEMERK